MESASQEDATIGSRGASNSKNSLAVCKFRFCALGLSKDGDFASDH